VPSIFFLLVNRIMSLLYVSQLANCYQNNNNENNQHFNTSCVGFILVIFALTEKVVIPSSFFFCQILETSVVFFIKGEVVAQKNLFYMCV